MSDTTQHSPPREGSSAPAVTATTPEQLNAHKQDQKPPVQEQEKLGEKQAQQAQQPQQGKQTQPPPDQPQPSQQQSQDSAPKPSASQTQIQQVQQPQQQPQQQQPHQQPPHNNNIPNNPPPLQQKQFTAPTPIPAPPAPPQATPSAPRNASPPSRMDLKGWWKQIRPKGLGQDQHHHGQDSPKGIFGVPLHKSIQYANVAISLIDDHGDSYIYGYVPIVVAKCGVYLKEKATGVEGIFRLSGSEKRIKELKTIFDSPDRYGKGLVWDGYTVHDAANVFRRYLNDLPEPVIPLDMYERFREPLKGATKKTTNDGDGPVYVENFDLPQAIRRYQHLINELPGLNRQLLLYILDLLAVFAAKSDENRMTSQNLAAVFSPGIISHPMHAMAPEEYRLNQVVLIFLIENQDHFLIGMAPPPPETAASVSETQKSIPETVTSGTELAVASPPGPTTAPVPTSGAPPTNPAPTDNNSMPPPPVPAASKSEATKRNESSQPGRMKPPTSIAMPDKDNYNRTPQGTPSIPTITTPQPERAGTTDYIGSPSGDEQMGSPTNGLNRSRSVPGSSGGRNKLRKPRPTSQNPSAQSSSTSLAVQKG